MVIDDDDVALISALVHQRQKASLELLALLTGTKIPPRVHLGPGRALLRQRLDLGAIPEFGGLLPLPNDLKIGDLLKTGQDRLLLRIIDFLAAGVIAAALHIADLQRPIEMLLQEGYIL